jgi:hypothetical protein
MLADYRSGAAGKRGVLNKKSLYRKSYLLKQLLF